MALLTALLVSAGITAAVSAGTSIAAQAMQNKSVKETNEMNKELNLSNNAFNAEQASIDRDFQSVEAQKQRDWEEQMSNTAVQRKAADIEAAGFNPALAVTQPGASTPGAVAASGSRASASGFIPTRAQDYSPMAAMSANLSHLVSSANSIIMLQRLANKNPAAMANLAGLSSQMSRSVTSAGRVPSLAQIEREIRSNGIDWAFDKYVK